MKIDVGMYVRTERGKIWLVTSTKAIDGHRRRIVKASYNIKELLQVGDFVDYEYPTGLGMWYCKNVEITEHLLNVFKNGENNHEYKITSIVTKEQFEVMKYEIK